MNCGCIIGKIDKETISAWLPLLTALVIASAGVIGVLIQVDSTRKNIRRENIHLAFSDLLMHLYVFQRGGLNTTRTLVNQVTFLKAIGKCQVSLRRDINIEAELQTILGNIVKDYIYSGNQSNFPSYIDTIEKKISLI